MNAWRKDGACTSLGQEYLEDRRPLSEFADKASMHLATVPVKSQARGWRKEQCCAYVDYVLATPTLRYVRTTLALAR